MSFASAVTPLILPPSYLHKMSADTASAMKATKPGFEESAEGKAFPIRMTLSSTKVKAIEQGMFDFGTTMEMLIQ